MDVYKPEEILKLKDLNSTEKDVLSVYKYFTERGKNKCCTLTNVQIADGLYISVIYVKQIKSHLKELGYIRTEGGIKVVYVGPKNKVEQDAIAYPNSMPEHTPQYAIAYPNSMPEHTHKEEKKLEKKELEKLEKKELEKELNEKEKIALANLKLVVKEMHPDYRTPEQIKYIWDHYQEKLSSADFSDTGTLVSYARAFQNILLKEFPEKHMIDTKPKTKSDTIDMF